MIKILFRIIFFSVLSVPLFAQKFVAIDGSDTYPGTFNEPFATLSRAISDTVRGDTIYVRGGTYALEGTLNIGSSESGSETGRKCLFAYPGERPLLDFSKTTNGAKGISMKAGYWHIRGFDVTTTLENCWSWRNGYLKDGSDPGSQTNGNGFKMGGGDDGNSLQLMHHFILKRCLSFGNKGKGFDQNNNAGSMTLLNCTAHGNKVSNYRITRTPGAGQTAEIKNCVSFGGAVELGGFAVQERNSWMPPFAVTAEDFLSVDPSPASAPRKADGGLPDMDFMRPATRQRSGGRGRRSWISIQRRWAGPWSV